MDFRVDEAVLGVVRVERERSPSSKISHIEINVINYSEAIKFYDIIFSFMGIKRVNCMKSWTAYTDGQSKIIICPTDDNFKSRGFHRKSAGLNHLAFYAESKKDVDNFYQNVLITHNIQTLYENGAFGNDDYYAVFFEGPDRLKLEFVYAPKYCDENKWPSNIQDDFNPYIDDEEKRSQV